MSVAHIFKRSEKKYMQAFLNITVYFLYIYLRRFFHVLTITGRKLNRLIIIYFANLNSARDECREVLIYEWRKH